MCTFKRILRQLGYAASPTSKLMSGLGMNSQELGMVFVMIEHAFNLKIGSIIDKLVSLVKVMQQQDKLRKIESHNEKQK